MRKEKIKENLLEKYREIFQKYASKKGIDVETYVEEFIQKSKVIPGLSEIKAVARDKDENKLINYLNTVEKLTNMNVYEKETKETSLKENLLEKYREIFQKYGSLEPEKFNDLDTKIEEPIENKKDLSGLDRIVFDEENKNKPLLDKYKEEITRVIFGNHFSGIMGKGLDLDEEINKDLTKIIKKGEEKYGDTFISELLNNKTKEEVYTTLKNLKLELKAEKKYSKYGSLEPASFEDIDDLNTKIETPKGPKPDLSGLDKIIFDETNEKCKDIVPYQKEESKEIVPYQAPIKKENIKPKKGKRKKASTSLIKKFKEKIEDPKFKKRFLIVAIVIALGVPAAVIISAITGDASHATNIQMAVSNIDLSQINDIPNNLEQITNNISPMDYYSQIGENSTVFSNAMDAANHTNSLIANEWFQSNPLDVYNTQTNEYMHLTHDQLNNIDLMRELANDPNNAILFGESLENPSGFMNLSDVISENIKGMSR